MSSRNIRRLAALKEQQQQKEKKENDEPDEEPDEEPDDVLLQVVKNHQSFQGLEVSSESEPECPPPGDSRRSTVIPEEDKYGAKKKTYTEAELAKKNKKANKKTKKNKSANKKPFEMDEVEWSLYQVNQELGSPPQKVEEVVVNERELRKNHLFHIPSNQLNVNFELAKVFGDEERLKKSQVPLSRRMSHWIGLSPEIQPIRIKGIVMTRYKTEGDVKYFRFTHSHDYRTRCMELVKRVRGRLFDRDTPEGMLYSENCVEGFLENSDFLYHVEEHKGANQSLEQALFCMQIVGEPSFNYVDGNTRLLYEFVENRPFHIALLKYLHVLTNTACHRTALALAKVLLNLDPSDPLAVIFIIDTLAIRAREFKWLVDLIDSWRETRQADRLFHMRYSRALALFHIATRTKNGTADADAALSKAIVYFPSVAVKIIEYSKICVPDAIKNHALLTSPANVPNVSREMQQLMELYAWLIAPRWREPYILKWFIKVLKETTEQYDQSRTVRDTVVNNAKLNTQLYRKLPIQVRRHLYAIRPMAKYISDGHMPILEPTVSFNPYPREGPRVDTYKYFADWDQEYESPRNALLTLIGELYPNFDQMGRRGLAIAVRRIDGTELIINNDRYRITLIYTEELCMHRVVSRRLPRSPQREHPQTYRMLPVGLRAAMEYNIGDIYWIGIRWGEEPASPLHEMFVIRDYWNRVPTAFHNEIEEISLVPDIIHGEQEYLPVNIFLGEELEVPMLITKVIALQLIGAIQVICYIRDGAYLRERPTDLSRYCIESVSDELNVTESNVRMDEGDHPSDDRPDHGN